MKLRTKILLSALLSVVVLGQVVLGIRSYNQQKVLQHVITDLVEIETYLISHQ
jgi:hypothetical protein